MEHCKELVHDCFDDNVEVLLDNPRCLCCCPYMHSFLFLVFYPKFTDNDKDYNHQIPIIMPLMPVRMYRSHDMIKICLLTCLAYMII